MSSPRYVVLALANPRAAWFRSVAQWTNAGSLPVDLVTCVSPEELSAHLRSDQPFSALLVDVANPAVDRDVIAAAHHEGCSVIVVDDSRRPRDWVSLGADAVLSGNFGQDQLIDALANACVLDRTDDVPAVLDLDPESPWTGTIVAVCGAGGAGTSTVAMALAQLLGGDVRDAGLVLLADLHRYGQQGMLHDVGDVVPDVQELVEAHRSGRLSPESVRSFTFSVPARGYHLLLGLRRPAAWPAIRPRAFEGSLATLASAFRIVVCDIAADFEGERDGGSLDVEERNTMSRVTAQRADIVYAVGRSDVKGIHSLVRVISDLLALGVPPERIVPVINVSPRSSRTRSEIESTLASLLPPNTLAAGVVHVPERKVDEAIRDRVALPAGLLEPFRRSWREVRSRQPRPPLPPPGPERIVPGSLGRWPDADEHPLDHDERAAG